MAILGGAWVLLEECCSGVLGPLLQGKQELSPDLNDYCSSDALSRTVLASLNFGMDRNILDLCFPAIQVVIIHK